MTGRERQELEARHPTPLFVTGYLFSRAVWFCGERYWNLRRINVTRTPLPGSFALGICQSLSSIRVPSKFGNKSRMIACFASLVSQDGRVGLEKKNNLDPFAGGI